MTASPAPGDRPAPPAFASDTDALVAAAKAGCRDSFGALAERYHKTIYAHAYRLMGDADEAADVTQDTMLKAWLAIGRTNDDLNLTAWLYRIAGNACLDRLRRRQRVRWIPWDAPAHDHLRASDDWRPEASAIQGETVVEVRAALDRMGRRHRIGLLLREDDALACEEIGQFMGLSRSAVKSMLHRARAELRVIASDLGITAGGMAT